VAVVRNLMIRIGADFSAARQTMQNATRELNRFKNDATRTTRTISGTKGIGGITTEFRNLGRTVTSSLSQIRGSKGLGGIAAALASIRPTLGAATSGLRNFALAAGGVTAALGPAGIAVAGVTTAVALLSAGLYKASQTAAKFEADIGRLNITLREGARAYMDWAQAQGLAKQTAAELGATYGNLLASFISDTKQLQESTQDLVHATRVIASYTGRDIDDVFNRIRSGMLGSTEAIEDLGVYVNISMIESTEAFRKFAGDKSWSQLTFQQQQQIRLAAILEQTYKRYGNELQQNVMTKQERLLEQFKDVKLHLSQMFLPLWDAVLPALTRFGESLAWVTEQLARFFYAIRGWDYDEMTRGTNQATDAINDQGDAYDDLAESAKKAVKQLAAFDEINQLGDFGDGSKGGTGSSGGGGFPTPPGTPSGGVIWDWPEVPPALTKRYRIEFDPPRPPDAGLGAVVTNVLATINDLTRETRAKMAQWLNDVNADVANGLAPIGPRWSGLLAGMLGAAAATFPLLNGHLTGFQSSLGVTVPPIINLGAIWSSTLASMLGVSQGTFPQLNAELGGFRSSIDSIVPPTLNVGVAWSTVLAGMLAELQSHRPLIEADWSSLKNEIKSIELPLGFVREEWKNSLAYVLSELRNFRPGFALEWAGLGVTLFSLIPTLDSVKSSWSTALESMRAAAEQKISPIIQKINDAIAAWMTLQSLIGGAVPSLQDIKSKALSALAEAGLTFRAGLEKVGEVVTPKNVTSDLPGRDLPVIGYLLQGLDWLSDKTAPFSKAAAPYIVPGAGMAGAGSAARGVVSQASKWFDDALQWISGLLKSGATVPAFASGGIVYGPTLAMIGEAGKEAVIPLEDTSFVDTLASAIGTAVVAAQQAAQDGQESDREIVIQIDGTTLARVMYPYQQQEQQRRGPAVIKTV